MVADPERQFLEAARRHGLYTRDRDFLATNVEQDKKIAALKALRTRPDRGQSFLLTCLADSDPSVVTAAASHLLPDKRAVEALERVARGGTDFVAFDAEGILEEWRAGRWSAE
jgi:hypothetical protein